VSASAEFIGPAEAARRLGVSAKALRLYEDRGLVSPLRTVAGWRTYGPDQMARAREIAALRGLGLSLAQIGRVLSGDAAVLSQALATHQAGLEGRMRDLAGTIDKVRALRAAAPNASVISELARIVQPTDGVAVAFDLPWPWGGERFELQDSKPVTYIVGPLGSGKTRFAMRLAESVPGAVFLGLKRSADEARSRLDRDPGLASRVERAIETLAGDGATRSDALLTLLAGLEAEGPTAIVADMVEHGLDEETQEALAAYLRRYSRKDRPLFLMTRSTSILDLADIGPGVAIVLCPANHSPPALVQPFPGAPGYEAVATCLAAPAVRARTEGVIAWRPEVA
jgi:DNA-binding transcriptional MerR regulator